MSEELRRVRDTLIEELRKSETLTVAGRALFNRYAAMCEAASGAAPAAAPEPPPIAAPPAEGAIDPAAPTMVLPPINPGAVLPGTF
jgi:hypothetical protein